MSTKIPDDHSTPSEDKPEIPVSIHWLQRQYTDYQQLTTQKISDNLWIIGLKWFLKGIMILILIIMSPFILLVIIFSLFMAG